jgi:hypothetical protein
LFLFARFLSYAPPKRVPTHPPTAYNRSILDAIADVERVATLWRLEWNDEKLLCAVYRGGEGGLQLCVESPSGIIVSERFSLRPRAVARVRALRDSLLRRGWRDAAASYTV